MSTPAVRAPDTRNVAWVQDNVGAKLLSKMGWKQGQTVGRRRSSETISEADSTSTEQAQDISSEGIRVVKRQDGLGLGASHILHMDTSHTRDFSHLLQHLKEHHATSDSSAKSKRKSKDKAKVHLPTNKTTHHKVRQAKFKPKSHDDLKCIFAGAVDFPVITATGSETTKKDKKQKKSKDKSEKRRKSKKSKEDE